MRIETFLSIPRGPNVSPVGEADPAGVGAEARALLDFLNARPSIKNMTPDEVRAIRAAAGNPLDYAAVEGVARRDFRIPGPVGDIPARLYRPSGMGVEATAGLVYFHGGGYVLGSVETYDRMMAELAKRSGVPVISVDYHLAPEQVFPTQVSEAQASFNWLHGHAADFGLDPARLAIGGDSAGGNLSAAVCFLNRDAGAPPPALQLLIYPGVIGNDASPTRAAYAEGLLLTRESIEWFHGHYIQGGDPDDPRFNLMRQSDFSGLPPAFILTGGYDPLRDEGEKFGAMLVAQGGAVRHSCYRDMIHAFLSYGAFPQAQIALDECAAVLRSL